MKQDQENRKKAMEWWYELSQLNVAFVTAACGMGHRNYTSFTGREIEKMYNKMHEPITLNRTIVNKNTITLSEQDIDDLKRMRDYFGKNDKTVFSHFAFKVIDDILNKIQKDG